MGSCRGGNSITVNCKNCKIGGYHDSSFLTSGTRPAQVSGQLFAMCRKSSTFAAWFKLWVTLTIPSALSPKWVPSKSHFLADKDGRKEGGRRIQLGACSKNSESRIICIFFLKVGNKQWLAILQAVSIGGCKHFGCHFLEVWRLEVINNRHRFFP